MNNFFIVFITYVLICGTFMMFFYEYGILTRWMFRNRFLIDGSLMGLMISSIPITVSYNRYKLNIMSLLMTLVTFVIITVVYFIIYRKSFKNLYEETIFENEEGEKVIMSDQAALINEDVRKGGRLILTNKRLCFLTKKTDNYSFEINLHELTKAPKTVNNIGFFNAFSIQDGKMKIYIKYRRYWIKEIKKQMN